MDLTVPPNTLLAAGPDMLDPNFMHSVVWIGQHTPEGAYGLILNRPSQHTTADILSDDLALGRMPVPLHIGGPVGLDTLQILHRLRPPPKGSVEVDRGVCLGADLEQLGHLAQQHPERFARRARLFLGYAGWSPGQLENELLLGAWLPAPYSPRLIFVTEPERMWRATISGLGGNSQGLDEQPPDPRWN